MRIPYLPGGAGLFLWIDLRGWLEIRLEKHAPVAVERKPMHRDHGLLRISASFNYDGGHFSQVQATDQVPVGVEESALPPAEAAAEHELYLRLIHKHGLLLTPGGSMRAEAAGFFRCVFSAVDDDGFNVALERFSLLGVSPRAARAPTPRADTSEASPQHSWAGLDGRYG